jgi:hypothetical protein
MRYTQSQYPTTRLFGAFSEVPELEEVQTDLADLEDTYGQYLEQESLKSDIQCLRSWMEAALAGDEEAMSYIEEHAVSLLENVKNKLHAACKEIQRIDEESPSGCNFTGGKCDRINKAAATALHAEQILGKALNQPLPEKNMSPAK